MGLKNFTYVYFSYTHHINEYKILNILHNIKFNTSIYILHKNNLIKLFMLERKINVVCRIKPANNILDSFVE
jgi:hypothetical protein